LQGKKLCSTVVVVLFVFVISFVHSAPFVEALPDSEECGESFFAASSRGFTYVCEGPDT
jgi:hypothetical protein